MNGRGKCGAFFMSILILRTALPAQSLYRPYHLERGSRIWIDGTATIGSYECGNVAVTGAGVLDTNRAEMKIPGRRENSPREDARVTILVRYFDCGNPAMNDDMYAALKARQDSTIRYELIRAEELTGAVTDTAGVTIRTIGSLTIAGVTRIDTIPASVRPFREGKFEITGRKDLSMIDYHVVPPTAFFGLIRAKEHLVVHFDLIAAPDR